MSPTIPGVSALTKRYTETRLIIGLFIITAYIFQSAVAHALEGILIGARDGLRKSLSFLNFSVLGFTVHLGNRFADGVTDALNPVIAYAGKAAHAADAQIAKWFYGLERTVRDVYDMIEANVMMLLSLWEWTSIELYHGAIGKRIGKLEAGQAKLAKRPTVTPRQQDANAGAMQRLIESLIAGHLAQALQHLGLTRGGWLNPTGAPHYTAHPVSAGHPAAIPHPVPIPVPATQEALRNWADTLARGYEGLRAKIKEQGKALVGLGAAALTAVAIERLGVSWIRCSRWKQIGKLVCGPGGGFLHELASLLADFVALASICDVLPLIEKGFSEVAAPFIDAFTDASHRLCYDPALDAPALQIPQLYTPHSVGVTLHLP